MEIIRQYLNNIAPLSAEDWEKISNRFTKVVLPKGTVFVKEGQVCNDVFFISTGLVRLYVVNDGKEICRQFFFENMFFSEYESFLTRKPSKTFADVLEDTEVHRFSYADMQWFYEVIPGFQFIGRMIAESLFIKISERVNSFLTETPEQRYLNLIASRPKVMQRIPQYMIASYLGITPEHLSRIRKKIASQQGVH